MRLHALTLDAAQHLSGGDPLSLDPAPLPVRRLAESGSVCLTAVPSRWERSLLILRCAAAICVGLALGCGAGWVVAAGAVAIGRALG